MKNIDTMKTIDIITLILIIIGGVNWGLVGLADIDLVSAIFGEGAAETARSSTFSRIVYVLVGLSALWQLVPLSRMFSDEPLSAGRFDRR